MPKLLDTRQEIAKNAAEGEEAEMRKLPTLFRNHYYARALAPFPKFDRGLLVPGKQNGKLEERGRGNNFGESRGETMIIA